MKNSPTMNFRQIVEWTTSRRHKYHLVIISVSKNRGARAPSVGILSHRLTCVYGYGDGRLWWDIGIHLNIDSTDRHDIYLRRHCVYSFLCSLSPESPTVIRGNKKSIQEILFLTQRKLNGVYDIFQYFQILKPLFVCTSAYFKRY